MSSGYRIRRRTLKSVNPLRLGLRGFSGTGFHLFHERFCEFAKKRVLSNPLRSPSFRPSPSDPFWLSAFATGGLIGIIGKLR
jgi:hypothetical protein